MESETPFLQQANHNLHQLLLTINKGSPNGNLFISPFSIYMALALLAEGASGEAKAQLVSTFGFDPQEIIPGNVAQAIQDIFKQNNKSTALNLANSAWVQQGEELNQEYSKTIQGKYQALIEQVNFKDAATAGKVNQWIESNTGGMIKDMIQQLDPSTVLVLVNAIYFKGLWEKEFTNELVQEPFNISPQKQVTVSYMKATVKAKYLETDTTQFVMLPYKECSMTFVAALPKTGHDPVSQLDLSNIYALGRSFTNDVILSLPKFSFETKTNLNEILKSLGVTSIFAPKAGELGGILSGPVAVSDVIHQAKIEVDRKGTRAAAATVVTMLRSCRIPAPKPVVTLDRPFAFFIYDTQSQLTIFSGIYRAPQDEASQ